MTQTRPYFLRAIYEWIVDNQFTPYLAVNAVLPSVQVPMEHVSDGKIILNISPSAVSNLLIANDAISFSARFSGASRNLYIPMYSVLGIYAKENGEGMAFSEDEYDLASLELPVEPPPPKPTGKPSLKVVK